MLPSNVVATIFTSKGINQQNISTWALFLKGLHLCFYKQSIYKQLALGWQIPKQLSGLDPFSVNNNKNYKIKKIGLFFFVINVK